MIFLGGDNFYACLIFLDFFVWGIGRSCGGRKGEIEEEGEWWEQGVRNVVGWRCGLWIIKN
jgi:hypothetical protein